MPTECPKGKPCPEGFSDPAWCTVCLAEAEQLSKAKQVADSVELDEEDLEDLHEALVTTPPTKKLITTTGPPNVASHQHTIVGEAGPERVATIASATGTVQKGNMIRNVTVARYDTKCRSCTAEIQEGRTTIVGVRQSFYNNDPLRWLCQDCGLLYEQAYSQLINKVGGFHGAEETVSNGTTLLLFRWNDNDQQWYEVKSRNPHVARRRMP